MDAVGNVGIPIDVPVLQLMQRHWERIRMQILADVDKQYGAYPDGKWSEEGFENYLDAARILPFWPRTEKTGRLQADQQTFKEMALIFPQLNLLREARGSLGKVRPVDLDIGSDGRCRSAIFPFSTITGRNAPRRFPFSPAIWIRPLIRPEPGRAIALLRLQRTGTCDCRRVLKRREHDASISLGRLLPGDRKGIRHCAALGYGGKPSYG
jgi:hypothetical protein